MRMPHEITEGTNLYTCPMPLEEFVRRARMYDGVQVVFVYSSPAQPTDMTKQPGFPQSKGRQLG